MKNSGKIGRIKCSIVIVMFVSNMYLKIHHMRKISVVFGGRKLVKTLSQTSFIVPAGKTAHRTSARIY